MAWLTQHQYLKVQSKFSAARLELKHSAVLATFATRVRTKYHSVLCSQNLPTLSPFFRAELRDHPWVLIAVLMQLQRLTVLPEFLAAKLELKYYAVLIASTTMQRMRPRPVLRFQSLRVLSPPLQIQL